MSAEDPSTLTSPDLRDDLQAAVAARRELGPDLEDEVLAAFLARVDAHIDERLAGARPVPTPKSYGKPEDAVARSIALSIPLLVLAGIFGHEWGVIAVVAGLVLINLLYFVDRWAS